jgi:hypothetical protein
MSKCPQVCKPPFSKRKMTYIKCGTPTKMSVLGESKSADSASASAESADSASTESKNAALESAEDGNNAVPYTARELYTLYMRGRLKRGRLKRGRLDLNVQRVRLTLKSLNKPAFTMCALLGSVDVVSEASKVKVKVRLTDEEVQRMLTPLVLRCLSSSNESLKSLKSTYPVIAERIETNKHFTRPSITHPLITARPDVKVDFMMLDKSSPSIGFLMKELQCTVPQNWVKSAATVVVGNIQGFLRVNTSTAFQDAHSALKTALGIAESALEIAESADVNGEAPITGDAGKMKIFYIESGSVFNFLKLFQELQLLFSFQQRMETVIGKLQGRRHAICKELRKQMRNVRLIWCFKKRDSSDCFDVNCFLSKLSVIADDPLQFLCIACSIGLPLHRVFSPGQFLSQWTSERWRTVRTTEELVLLSLRRRLQPLLKELGTDIHWGQLLEVYREKYLNFTTSLEQHDNAISISIETYFFEQMYSYPKPGEWLTLLSRLDVIKAETCPCPPVSPGLFFL